MRTLLDSKDFMVYIKTDIIFEHYMILSSLMKKQTI